MARLWQSLQSSLQNRLWACVLIAILIGLHIEEEFYVAGPDLKALMVLLAKLLVNIFDKLIIICCTIDVDQLKIHFAPVVDV